MIIACVAVLSSCGDKKADPENTTKAADDAGKGEPKTDETEADAPALSDDGTFEAEFDEDDASEAFEAYYEQYEVAAQNKTLDEALEEMGYDSFDAFFEDYKEEVNLYLQGDYEYADDVLTLDFLDDAANYDVTLDGDELTINEVIDGTDDLFNDDLFPIELERYVEG